jgi:hypothetical protein
VPDPTDPGYKYTSWLFGVVTGCISLMILSFIVAVLAFLYGPRCRPKPKLFGDVPSITTPRYRRRPPRARPRYSDEFFGGADAGEHGSAAEPKRDGLERWPSFSLLPRPSLSGIQPLPPGRSDMSKPINSQTVDWSGRSIGE